MSEPGPEPEPFRIPPDLSASMEPELRAFHDAEWDSGNLAWRLTHRPTRESYTEVVLAVGRWMESARTVFDAEMLMMSFVMPNFDETTVALVTEHVQRKWVRRQLDAAAVLAEVHRIGRDHGWD